MSDSRAALRSGAGLAVVHDLDELPEYPFGRDDALAGNSFLKWQVTTWFQSDMWLRAEPEVGYAFLNLTFQSQYSVPPGTIPVDPDGQLALLGNKFTLQKWRAMLRLDPGPLHKWQPYRCEGGEIRMGHPFVIGVIRDQITRREQYALSSERDAVRKRIMRMSGRLAGMGVDKAVLADHVLMERMDLWLTQNWRGNRTLAAYERVLMVAAQEGWLAPKR